ncbi:hypothetical protein J2W17_002136 [Pseudomonas lini]|nr:hypothetical protein [Pseudomonas lini]
MEKSLWKKRHNHAPNVERPRGGGALLTRAIIDSDFDQVYFLIVMN